MNLRNYYSADDKAEDFDVLPNGAYTVKVTGGEMRPTKNGDGEYLQIEMTVVEGEHQGRKIFDRFNLRNKNDMAVRIAKSQFAAFREAVGVLDPKDIPDFQNIRFQLVLKCVKRNDRPDEMTNVVGRYIKKGQTATTPQQHTEAAPYSRNASKPQQPPAASQAEDERPPW